MFGLRFLIILMRSYVENSKLKVACTFFSKNREKFTVVINKRTLLCKEAIKELSIFLRVYDKFVIVQQRWNTRYLLLFRKVFNIDQ